MVKVKLRQRNPDNLNEWIEKEFYLDGYIKANLDLGLQQLHNDFDQVWFIDGAEGCLSGDTQIQVSRFKLSRRYSLKKLYLNHNGKGNFRWDTKEPSYIRAFNGKEIRLHKIKNILYSGKKKIYLLSLENGLSIKATSTHKFLTNNNIWVELQDLNIGSELMCDTLHTEKTNRKRIKLYDIQLHVGKNHPYSSKTGRVEVHRLIYESYINNLRFVEYLDILLNEKEISKTLKFIDTSIYDIHHKDGNHYNNSIDNLEWLLKSEHRLEHGEYSNFSQGIPKFSKVIGIKPLLEEDVYDIECEEPYHNFVANGIVVHNSGKSDLAAQYGYYVNPEETRHNFLDRFCLSAEEFDKVILEAKQFDCIVLDEAFGGMSSSGTMGRINRVLQRRFTEIRAKNLFIFIVAPSFMDIMRYFAIWRSKCLLHVYLNKDRDRGFCSFYGEQKKRKLFILGKKHFYNYSIVPPQFTFRFIKQMYKCFERDKYLEKKGEVMTRSPEDLHDEKIRDKKRELVAFFMKNLEKMGNPLSPSQKAQLFGYSLRNNQQIAKEMRENERFGDNILY